MSNVTSKQLAIALTFGGAALTIITYLLPPKNPASVLVLLMVVFLLLLYPAWVFSSSEKHRWLRILAITVLAIAVAVFGFYVWPIDDATANSLQGRSFVTRWFERSITYAKDLPWVWILSSLTIGAFGADRLGTMIRKRRRMREVTVPKVEILTPLNGEEVGWHRIIRGSVYPADSATRVLIRPADGWWYVQRDPCAVRGHAWSFNGEFSEKEIAGEPYDVVAIYSTSLTEDRYRSLPENLVKSNVVRVNRRLLPDFIDCPDKLLHQTAVDDRSRIRELVKVCAVNCDTSHLAEGNKKPYEDFTPYVEFIFCFLNFYLRPVSIDLSQGFITFQKDATGQAYKLKNDPELIEGSRARNCPFRDADCFFKIRQDIDQNQFMLITSGSKESVFYFQDVNIMITGEGLKPVSLDVPNVQKGIPWIAHTEAGFVQATITSLKSDHAERIATLNDEIESLRLDCKSRLERTTILSEVIGRANELESVHKDPQFIPLDQLKSLAFEIKSALHKCYSDKALERFYPFPFKGQSMEGPEQYVRGTVQWFIDYRHQLMVLLKDECEAVQSPT